MNNAQVNTQQVQQPKGKSNALLIGIIVFVVTAALTFGLVTFMNKSDSVQPTSGTGQGTVQPTSTTTKVTANGFTYEVPSTMSYELESDVINIYDDSLNWVAQLWPENLSYNVIKVNKDQIKSNLASQGITAKDAEIKTYNNVEFVTIEATQSSTTFIAAYSKIDASNSLITTIQTRSGVADYTILEKIAPIAKSITKASSSNSMKIAGFDAAKAIENIK